MFPIACLRRLLSCQPFSLLATQTIQITHTTRASEARGVVALLLEEL